MDFKSAPQKKVRIIQNRSSAATIAGDALK